MTLTVITNDLISKTYEMVESIQNMDKSIIVYWRTPTTYSQQHAVIPKNHIKSLELEK